MSAVLRTWLYVPAYHAERARKALTSGADAVVLDLEDSVPAERKDEARQGALSILRDLPAERPQVWVRVNPLTSPWGEADASALAGSAADGVRVPRAEDPEEVAVLAGTLGCPLQLLVETARGLRAARELAEAHPQVAGIALGEADLAADLRVAERGLDWARGWIVVVARAAGLPSPVQSVYTDVADLEGLRATTADGRDRGFLGRSVIHPRQVSPVHEVYRPAGEALARARELLSAYDRARERGDAAVLTPDGRFVDPAVVAQAQLVLTLASLDPSSPPAPSPTEENR
ncbi:MAG TPA: CoA ester lyase [Intrasporangium sp.]|uniref:HpcH/HpaI aldolase/citrate lyase family protein n=1 Tax=Intrasporangium sp. TaxID=1925024 RepID=UPI002D79A52D|nr:CoA ester lyase [Intrasporangium sp.]HET7400093.1 CoA ester lyase [Intrasporangium sp.]